MKEKIKEFFNKIGITKDTVERAVKTFLQAFLAYIVTVLAAGDYLEGEITKKALVGLLMSALAAGVSAVMNMFKNAKPEQLGGGTTFESWVNKYLGKRTDYDGAYGVQCVDLIDCYIEKCLGLKKDFWGNAKNWWTDRNSSSWLKKNFDFVTPKYKNGELKKGDIGIRTSGTYGHIFVVYGPAANGKFKYYDQNATGNGDKMTLREKAFSSSYINGILRPKNQSNLKSATLPSYTVGKTYTITDVRGVYADKYAKTRKKVKQLTANGKQNATSKNANNNAYFKKGTRVTVQEVFKNTSAKKVMIKCPSGWITAYNANTNWMK